MKASSIDLGKENDSVSEFREKEYYIEIGKNKHFVSKFTGKVKQNTVKRNNITLRGEAENDFYSDERLVSTRSKSIVINELCLKAEGGRESSFTFTDDLSNFLKVGDKVSVLSSKKTNRKVAIINHATNKFECKPIYFIDEIKKKESKIRMLFKSLLIVCFPFIIGFFISLFIDRPTLSSTPYEEKFTEEYFEKAFSIIEEDVIALITLGKIDSDLREKLESVFNDEERSVEDVLLSEGGKELIAEFIQTIDPILQEAEKRIDKEKTTKSRKQLLIISIISLIILTPIVFVAIYFFSAMRMPRVLLLKMKRLCYQLLYEEVNINRSL